jgi:hypothetical protein
VVLCRGRDETTSNVSGLDSWPTKVAYLVAPVVQGTNLPYCSCPGHAFVMELRGRAVTAVPDPALCLQQVLKVTGEV